MDNDKKESIKRRVNERRKILERMRKREEELISNFKGVVEPLSVNWSWESTDWASSTTRHYEFSGGMLYETNIKEGEAPDRRNRHRDRDVARPSTGSRSKVPGSLREMVEGEES